MKLTADLPIVDPKEGLASEALERGILETGFFLLRDRSIALESLHQLRRETYAFFARPQEEKMRLHQPARGYIELREEDSAAGFGTGKYGQGDFCEKFTMGPIVSDTEMDSDPSYYRPLDAELYFAQNVFPNNDFKEVWENYYRHMRQLGDELMAAIKSILGYADNQWADQLNRPVSVLRFLGYPPAYSKQQRLDEHYDDDLITILHQSPTANGFDALEVMLPGESVWRSVPADDEMFVVNMGEALTYLTGGKVVSTKHRVASPPEELAKGSARSSAVYFHLPNWNARLQPVFAGDMDHQLGLEADSFHLDDLKEPDGSIYFYKMQQRQLELMIHEHK